MAPDFEKFITMSAHDPHSHTWRSIFYFNLPIGLLIAFVFHLLVRDALIENLPGFLRRRLSRFKQHDWVAYFKQHYVIVIISILLGAASHLFWDSFTHKGGRGAGWLPFTHHYVIVSGHRLYGFYIMQLLSSLAGACVVFYAVIRLPSKSSLPDQTSVLPYWFVVSAIAVVVAGLRLWLWEYEDRDLIFTLIAAVLAGLIATPLLLKKFSPRT